MDWETATVDERESRRAALIESGSLFADDITRCGAEFLPCGLCNECVAQGVLDWEQDR